ncbi:MAG: GNAT family N-acetyltransferase [Steroidobacteraceae bacterium]|nr:GNAT family N-acetyltransferase [Steroidobacteraceae bacterium]
MSAPFARARPPTSNTWQSSARPVARWSGCSRKVFAFDASKLRAPEISFWTIWDDETLLGCAALKELSRHQGEIKSMRTPASMRGRGAGRALLAHILDVAKGRKYEELFLETGSHPDFDAAQNLYRSVGFQPCRPFGQYRENANSVFMSMRLAPMPAP